MDKSALIDYYNELAFQWDSLCEQNQEKMRCIVSLCQLAEGSRILYAACATGNLTPILLETQPKRILAADIAQNMIDIAQKKFAHENVEFRCADIMELTGDLFDCVMLYDAFHHFENRGNITRHMHHLLAPQGRLMICHTQSRTQINCISQQSARFSMPLPAARTLAATLDQYFDVDIMIDSPDFYVVSGRRRTLA